MNTKMPFDTILHRFKDIIKKPENLLTVQDILADQTKLLLKELYDYLKSRETKKNNKDNTLAELIIQEFDEEQIWQEVDLQNEAISNSIVAEVAHVLAKKSRLTFNVPSSDESLDNEDQESELSSLDPESDDDNLSSCSNSNSESHDLPQKYNFTSELDDEFFKLSEMENFCENAEKDEETGKRGDVDLFGAIDDSNDEDEREIIRYNDFFGKQSKVTRNSKTIQKENSLEFDEDEEGSSKSFGIEPSKKQVSFAKGPISDENNDGSENESDDSNNKVDLLKSGFDARQDRLKNKIEALEEEALKAKPWHLQGEAAANLRPQNSLLEEFLQFDLAARPAPVFTEKTTMRLEDIILQRVKDKSWDDVVRKVKPVEDIREYRKQLVLNQEKSKISLAEVYEQEYIKQRDSSAAQPGEEKPVTEPEEHVEIKKMMKNLISKLDALSNFHYTPKQVEPEIKIISNLPAITMEEVAPVATSDAALLAPEEVKDKKKGELLGQNDRTSTDKKRSRRLKKQLQRKKQQEKIRKEKSIDKMALGLGNKYSKEKAKRTLEQLTKERNVDKMVENKGKHIKSSTTFFSKLEDEVKTQLKRKSIDADRKTKSSKFNAKRIKL